MLLAFSINIMLKAMMSGASLSGTLVSLSCHINYDSHINHFQAKYCHSLINIGQAFQVPTSFQKQFFNNSVLKQLMFMSGSITAQSLVNLIVVLI